MKKIVLSISIVLFIILCFVFNKYDLDISIYLTQFYNGFYEFFDDVGEIPIYFGPILFGATYCTLSKKPLYKYLSACVSFIAFWIASVKIVGNMEYVVNIKSIILSACMAVILTVITVFAFSKISKDKLDKIKDLALLGLIVSVVSFAEIQVIKNLWGRVRFRDLSSDYSEFTNLFTINGINGNHSFPSGHTNAGTSILLISLLVPRFTGKKWIKYLTTSLCFIYIAILAFSRIVVSAHYASDVLVGFVVGFTTLCVTYHILNRKGVINASSNKC